MDLQKYFIHIGLMIIKHRLFSGKTQEFTKLSQKHIGQSHKNIK